MRRIIVFSVVLTILCASIPLFASESEDEKFARALARMVSETIEKRGIKDPLTLKAMRAVKRHAFVPKKWRRLAYADTPLEIGHEQTISQPYIVAYMTEALKIKPGDKVLEIGTGSAYQAAVLAEITKEVYTVEIICDLATTAETRLKKLGYNTVKVKCGDGYKGWKEHAPFDAIIVTAAPPKIPQPLLDQLKDGGRLVLPVGKSYQKLTRVTKKGDVFEKEYLLPVAFVPMTGPGTGIPTPK
jgi:protein-L-isoaspartate(D-aspartate) O-methyltransferase